MKIALTCAKWVARKTTRPPTGPSSTVARIVASSFQCCSTNFTTSSTAVAMLAHNTAYTFVVTALSNRDVAEGVDPVVAAVAAARSYDGAPAAIAALRDAEYPPLGSVGPLRLLVLGGSQGARVLSEVIPAAVALLPEALRRRLEISQQCRPEDLDGVRLAYRGAEVSATLESFFHDVPERMSAAHLVIARSGASTVAELTALGRPAILVPYPHAIDDHQTANAHAVDDVGAAWLMPQTAFTPQGLATRLESLFTQPGTLVRAAECARTAARPDAASRLADLVADLLGSPTQESPS